MLEKSTLEFLKKLKKNNNKEWFDANRGAYEKARNNVADFVRALIRELAVFDPSIQHLEPRDCMYRINRDIRFSHDRTPYKTNMGVYLSRGGKKAMDLGGYYVHIEPGQAFVAGGMWQPPAPALKKIRQAIDYDWHELDAIVQDKNFRKTFGSLRSGDSYSLQRPPRGFEADHEGIEYLKLKSYIASHELKDADLTAPDAPVNVAKLLGILTPLVEYLNENVQEG